MNWEPFWHTIKSRHTVKISSNFHNWNLPCVVQKQLLLQLSPKNNLIWYIGERPPLQNKINVYFIIANLALPSGVLKWRGAIHDPWTKNNITFQRILMLYECGQAFLKVWMFQLSIIYLYLLHFNGHFILFFLVNQSQFWCRLCKNTFKIWTWQYCHNM